MGRIKYIKYSNFKFEGKSNPKDKSVKVERWELSMKDRDRAIVNNGRWVEI